MKAPRTRRGLTAIEGRSFGGLKAGFLLGFSILAFLFLWTALKDAQLSEAPAIVWRVGAAGLLALLALNLLAILAMASTWRVLINACGCRVGFVRLGGYRMAAKEALAASVRSAKSGPAAV